MTVVLGIHFGHDSSAALVRDGRIVAAVSEERLKRVKLYRGFPEEAIETVLRYGDVTPGQVDRVGIASTSIFRTLGADEMRKRLSHGVRGKLEHQRAVAKKVLEYFVGGAIKKTSADEEEAKAATLFYEHFEKLGFKRSQTRLHDHHLCHAASAFFCSPFEEAHVFTVDGRGDGLCATAGHGSGWDLSSFARVGDLHSVGMFYAAVTLFLGFRPNRHEGKITGLAAMGDPARVYDQLRRLFKVDRESKTIVLELDERYQTKTADDVRAATKDLPLSLKDRINLMAVRDFDVMLYAVNWYSLLRYLAETVKDVSREDVAAAAQKVAEDVITEWVGPMVDPGRPLPVTLAGGVFANVKINQRIGELDGVSNVYVQPAMGDDGLAAGVALLEYVQFERESGRELPPSAPRSSRMETAYLGMEYDTREIENACRAEDVEFRLSKDPAREAAELIHEGKLVGRFSSRMEWGPRALGNRSILIRPTDKGINDSVNKRLQRTEFMPFAPSMLDTAAPDYLIGWRPDHVAAEFMTITYDIVPERQKEIEAVVHVDGTARPQVVRREANPGYYRVLEEYEKLSGLGAIVNTSFNVHEEPIVGSPEDAIRSLKKGCVDVLFLEDHVVTTGK